MLLASCVANTGKTVSSNRLLSVYAGPVVVIASVNSTVCWMGADGDTVKEKVGKTIVCKESIGPTAAMLSTSLTFVELSRNVNVALVHAASQFVTPRSRVTLSPGSMMSSPSVVVYALLVTEIAGVFLIIA